MTVTKTNFTSQIEEIEVREYNNAVVTLAYSARTLISDIEKLEAALDLFRSLEAKLDDVDNLSADQIRELNTEFVKARSNLVTSGNLIVDGSITANQIAANTITADRIPVGSITATKLAINNLVARK